MLLQKQVVRVLVLEVQRQSQRLLASMKYESLSRPPPEGDRLQMGLVHPQSVPRSYAATVEARDNGMTFSSLLESSSSLMNPTGVEELAKEVGLSFKAGKSTLFSGMIHSYHPETTAAFLRKEQTSRMALSFVSQGVKYFKEGSNVEAFQCLNKALSIDSNSVEALVARGALYANNGSLEKAVADFEAGLALNGEHRNAKKYLCETLLAMAKTYEDDDNLGAALEAFEKVLKVEPDDEAAQEGIWVLRQLMQGVPRSLIG